MAEQPAHAYVVDTEPPAWDALMALPERTQDRVLSAIESLEREPRPSNSKALKGQLRGLWRIRVGDYRVVYAIENHRLVVVVVKVGDRKDIYE